LLFARFCVCVFFFDVFFLHQRGGRDLQMLIHYRFGQLVTDVDLFRVFIKYDIRYLCKPREFLFTWTESSEQCVRFQHHPISLLLLSQVFYNAFLIGLKFTQVCRFLADDTRLPLSVKGFRALKPHIAVFQIHLRNGHIIGDRIIGGAKTNDLINIGDKCDRQERMEQSCLVYIRPLVFDTPNGICLKTAIEDAMMQNQPLEEIRAEFLLKQFLNLSLHHDLHQTLEMFHFGLMDYKFELHPFGVFLMARVLLSALHIDLSIHAVVAYLDQKINAAALGRSLQGGSKNDVPFFYQCCNDFLHFAHGASYVLPKNGGTLTFSMSDMRVYFALAYRLHFATCAQVPFASTSNSFFSLKAMVGRWQELVARRRRACARLVLMFANTLRTRAQKTRIQKVLVQWQEYALFHRRLQSHAVAKWRQMVARRCETKDAARKHILVGFYNTLTQAQELRVKMLRWKTFALYTESRRLRASKKLMQKQRHQVNRGRAIILAMRCVSKWKMFTLKRKTLRLFHKAVVSNFVLECRRVLHRKYFDIWRAKAHERSLLFKARCMTVRKYADRWKRHVCENKLTEFEMERSMFGFYAMVLDFLVVHCQTSLAEIIPKRCKRCTGFAGIGCECPYAKYATFVFLVSEFVCTTETVMKPTIKLGGLCKALAYFDTLMLESACKQNKMFVRIVESVANICGCVRQSCNRATNIYKLVLKLTPSNKQNIMLLRLLSEPHVVPVQTATQWAAKHKLCNIFVDFRIERTMKLIQGWVVTIHSGRKKANTIQKCVLTHLHKHGHTQKIS
jgi:hypothetical protein